MIEPPTNKPWCGIVLMKETFFIDITHYILKADFNHLVEVDQLIRVVGQWYMVCREVVVWHHLTLQYGLVDI
jgi:hypothetical protein